MRPGVSVIAKPADYLQFSKASSPGPLGLLVPQALASGPAPGAPWEGRHPPDTVWPPLALQGRGEEGRAPEAAPGMGTEPVGREGRLRGSGHTGSRPD